jgi:hypothetical protein
VPELPRPEHPAQIGVCADTSDHFVPAEFQAFFDGVQAILVARPSDPGSAASLVNREELEKFFNAAAQKVDEAEKQQREIDKVEATGFNVFHLIEPDENKLSDILADLLNPKGSHGQGDLFLRLLFDRLQISVDPSVTLNAKVHREARTDTIKNRKRRMDILVRAGITLAFENKIDADEQENQVRDYLEHLRLDTQRNAPQSALIYLTPNGRRPTFLSAEETHQHEALRTLHCWSYQDKLKDWLAACQSACMAAKMRHFLLAFIDYIETDLKRDAEENEEKSDEN